MRLDQNGNLLQAGIEKTIPLRWTVYHISGVANTSIAIDRSIAESQLVDRA